MKRNITIIFFICMAISAAVSCTKEEDAPANIPTPALLDYVRNDQQLGIFNAAMKRAGLDQDAELKTGGPFTIFAPLDSACIAAGLTMEKVNTYDPQALAALLKYHIVMGRISSSSLIGFFTQDVVSLYTGFKPKINRNYFGIFMNGFAMAQSNIELGDGVLHKMKGFSFPPGGTLLKMMQQTPELSLFTEVVNRFPEMKQVLNDPAYAYPAYGITSGMTVFAPDNNAFALFGFKTADDIQAADGQLIRKMLSNWVVASKQFTSDMLEGVVIGGNTNAVRKLINILPPGSPFSYEITAGAGGFISRGNVTRPLFTRTNIHAVNGVLHIVDQVIIP